MFGPALVV